MSLGELAVFLAAATLWNAGIVLVFGVFVRVANDEIPQQQRQQLHVFAVLNGGFWTILAGQFLGLAGVEPWSIPGVTVPGVPAQALAGLLVGLCSSVVPAAGGRLVATAILPEQRLSELAPVIAGSYAFYGGLLAAWVGLLAVAVATGQPLVLPIGGAALGVLSGPALGLVFGLTTPVRSRTAAESAVVEAALATTGFDPDRVVVLVEPEAVSHPDDPFAYGFGRFKRVFVPEAVFETYDDESLETALVRFTVPSAARLVRWAGWGAIAGGVVAAAVLADASPGLAALAGAGLLVGWIALARRCRRLVYSADDRVAEELGADRLRALMTRHADDGTTGVLRRTLAATPPIDVRLERLD